MAAQPSGSFGQSFSIAHSANNSHNSSVQGNSSSFFGGGSHFADDSARNVQISNELKKGLGPEFLSQRPGPGGGPKLTYVEGWKLINVANDVFGFNGWSSQIVSLQIDYCDHVEGRYSVGASAIIRVTLRDGTYHEDVGTGAIDNARSKSQAFDKVKKEAVTDGIKRALRNFGNAVGNCVYDKSFCNAVTKLKVAPTTIDMSNLHRRPEFDPANASTSSTTSLARAAQQAPQQRPIAPATNVRQNASTNAHIQNSSVHEAARKPQLLPAPPVSHPAQPSHAAPQPALPSAAAVKLESKPPQREDSFDDFADIDEDILNMLDPDVGPPIHHEDASCNMSVVSAFEPVGHSTVVSTVPPAAPAVPKPNSSPLPTSTSAPRPRPVRLSAEQKAARDAMILAACKEESKPAPPKSHSPMPRPNLGGFMNPETVMQPPSANGAAKRTVEGQFKGQDTRPPLVPMQVETSGVAKRARY